MVIKTLNIPTLRQSSSGKCSNGSFFNLGETKLETKLNKLLSHIFSNSAKSRCLSAWFRLTKCPLASRKNVSSFSPAEFHVGALWNGVGEGAGVGGEAGAEGSILSGKLDRVDIESLFGSVCADLALDVVGMSELEGG